MKSFKSITLGFGLAFLLIAVVGCGGSDRDDRLDAGGDLLDEYGRATVSESLLSVKGLTDEVNQFVAGNFNGITETMEIKTAMAGFAEEYTELAGNIDTDDMTEADELALTLAREGEEKTAALAETLAENPGVIDYSDAAVVDWGEYTDKVYASVGEEPAISDPDYVNYKGIGKGQGKGQGRIHGKGKGLDKGYGWWKKDFASDDISEDERYRYRDKEQYRDRDRDQYRDGECDGAPKYDGSGEGKGKGTGSRDGSGTGRGKGYGGGKGKGQ